MTEHHHHDGSTDEIDCLEAIEQMYAYIDGELDDVEKKLFEDHISHCRSCFNRQEMEIALSKRLDQTSSDELPEELQKRLKNIIDNF